MSELRGYAASISKYTGVTDPADLEKIETAMVDEHRTLNGLSPQKFAKAARDGWKLVQYLRSPEGKAEWASLEAEYGIKVPL